MIKNVAVALLLLLAIIMIVYAPEECRVYEYGDDVYILRNGKYYKVLPQPYTLLPTSDQERDDE